MPIAARAARWRSIRPNTARSAARPGAELLRDLGRLAEARDADERALELTANPAEQSLLRQRLNWR